MTPQEHRCRHLVRRIRNAHFSEHIEAFDPYAAVICASLSELTYRTLPEADFDPERDWVPIEGPLSSDEPIDLVNIFSTEPGEEAQLFVIDTYFVKVIGVRIRDVVVVAIRGSKGALDWYNNFNIRVRPLPLLTDCDRPYGELLVHAGFLNLTSQIERGISREIQKIIRPDDKLLLTGHSLGGALCLLFAAIRNAYHFPHHRMRRSPEDWRVDAIYSFGSPMSHQERGDVPQFTTHHRVANGGDIVPFLPGKARLFQFSHDADALLLQLNSNSPPIVTPQSKMKSPIKGRLLLRLPHALRCHSVDAYRRTLEMCMPNSRRLAPIV